MNSFLIVLAWMQCGCCCSSCLDFFLVGISIAVSRLHDRGIACAISVLTIGLCSLRMAHLSRATVATINLINKHKTTTKSSKLWVRILYPQHPTLRLGSPLRNPRCWVSNIHVNQYQSCSWTTFNPATLSPDKTTLVFMHDCLEVKGEARYVEPGVLALTEIVLVQARFINPESRTDQSEPGSDGERTVHHHIRRQLLCFYQLPSPQ